MTSGGVSLDAETGGMSGISKTAGVGGRGPRLRTRLMQLVIVALIPSLAVLSYLYLHNQANLSHQIQGQALRLSRLVASEQASRIDAARQVMAVLAEIPDVRDGVPGKCSAALASVRPALKQSGYGAAALIRPDGTMYCADIPLSANPDRSERPFFKNVMARRAFSVGAYRIGGLTKIPVLVSGYPILDADGRITNIIAISITIEWFNALLSHLALPETASAVVFDAEGTILARYPESDGWVGKNVADSKLFRRIKQEKSGMAEEIGLENVERLVGYSEVGGDLGEVYVLVGFDRADSLGATGKSLLLGPGLMVVVGFLSFVFVLYGLHRILLRNLDKLVAATRRVEAGDLSARSGLTGEAGEFGDLGRSFDAMAEALAYRDGEIRRRTNELTRSNEELQQFAYVASHDLQEPLRMVGSYVQLLARRYKGRLDDDADEFIGFAVDGAVRMQRLLDGLLTFSRVRTHGTDFKPVVLDDVFASTAADLKGRIEESDAEVTSDPLPQVLGDKAQLGQVFQNLISNALKFRGADAPRIHVSAKRDGSEWVISVRDNGIGIDPQFGDKVFIIFKRLHTRAEYPGDGLGLATARRIVDRHGGRMWFESELGQGATFFFSLPIMETAS